MEYKENVVYKVKCKKSTKWGYCENVKKDEWYKCMKKERGNSGKIRWHTDQRTEFGFSWSHDGFKNHFHAPVEILSDEPLTLKLALERSIEMWKYMVDNDCSKYNAIKSLWGEISIPCGCWLCEYDTSKSDQCNDCIRWTKYHGDQCDATDSPYSHYLECKTVENAQKVLDHLKSEYKRLFEIKPVEKSEPVITHITQTLDIDLDEGINLDDMKVFVNGINYVKSKTKSTEWNFKDNEINFSQICNDCLKDNLPGFLVVGDNKAYVGLIHSGKQVGIPLNYTDFDRTGSFVSYIPDFPYGIFEISLSKIGVWKEKLKKYSEDYKNWVKDLDKEIRNRDRDKTEASCYKVYAF